MITTSASTRPRRRVTGFMGRIGRAIGFGLAALAIVGATAWGALALYYLAPGPQSLRAMAAAALACLGLIALARLPRRKIPLGLMAAFVPVAMIWHDAQPSNDRDWRPEVAVLPYAEIDGDAVTVHNIRNFDYRTETDFTPAYYDKTFDLRKLDRIDLVGSYWMGEAIAHLFLTFGFGDDFLAVSIEARRDKARPYATLPGFFKQYELVYVVGDERDLIRVRTHYRKDPPEEVYLFRLRGTAEERRRLFLEYVRDLNALRQHPRFYNILTTNCTTTILDLAAANPRHMAYSWKILASGYAPEYAYDIGRLDTALPFGELKRRGHVNAAALAAGQAPDFSRRIRADVP